MADIQQTKLSTSNKQLVLGIVALINGAFVLFSVFTVVDPAQGYYGTPDYKPPTHYDCNAQVILCLICIYYMCTAEKKRLTTRQLIRKLWKDFKKAARAKAKEGMQEYRDWKKR